MIAMCLFNRIVDDGYAMYGHPTLKPFALNVMEVIMVESDNNLDKGYESTKIRLKDGSEIEVAETMMDVLQAIKACVDMAYGH